MSISSRPLALLLAAVILAGAMLPGYTETDDFFRYRADERGDLHIVGYEGYDKNLTIPGEIDGAPVVAIDETAFYGNSTLRSVTLSPGISCVERDAFAYCENLNEVTFSEGSGVFIGEAAFEGCTLLESVTFSDDLTEIDDLAFRGCVRLGRVRLPSSLTRIGYHAFADCERLVLDASECEAGRSYAAENEIDLSYRESAGFQSIELVLLIAAGLLLALAVFLLLRHRRKGRRAGASPAKK